MVDVRCPCGNTLSVPEQHAGKKVKCPACEAPVAVPLPEEDLALDLDSSPAPSAPRDVQPWEAQAAQRSGPLQTKDRSQKSFHTMLIEVVVNPGEAFDAMGIYIMTSPINIACTIGMYVTGLFLVGMLKSQFTGADVASVSFLSVVLGRLVHLAVAALLYDVAARIIAGVSRFVPMLVTLVFLEGVVSICGVAIVPIFFLDPGFGVMAFVALWVWALLLHYVAIAATYGVDGIYALVFVISAVFLERYLLGVLALAS